MSCTQNFISDLFHCWDLQTLLQGLKCYFLPHWYWSQTVLQAAAPPPLSALHEEIENARQDKPISGKAFISLHHFINNHTNIGKSMKMNTITALPKSSVDKFVVFSSRSSKANSSSVCNSVLPIVLCSSYYIGWYTHVHDNLNWIACRESHAQVLTSFSGSSWSIATRSLATLMKSWVLSIKMKYYHRGLCTKIKRIGTQTG